MNFFSAHAISTGVLSSLLATAMVMPVAASASETRADTKAIESVIACMHWLGHDGFWIDASGTILYIDPYQISGGPKADIILITHSHQDHASVDDVAKIAKADTVIVTVAAAAEKFPGKNVRVVQPGQRIVVKDIPIETVPAYNTNKFRSPGVPFHPKDAGFVGYIVTLNGVRIYHTGDSDVIDEMKDIHCDIALLPVSGIYVMTAEEAAKAGARLRPSVAIPMHVGKGIGSLEDAEHFQKLSSVPVKILKIE